MAYTLVAQISLGCISDKHEGLDINGVLETIILNASTDYFHSYYYELSCNREILVSAEDGTYDYLIEIINDIQSQP
jgi:ferritin-like protein